MATYTVKLFTWAAGVSLVDRGDIPIGRDDAYTASKIRNGIGDFQFTHSIWDPVCVSHLNDADLRDAEVELRRNGTPIWRGVPVASESSLLSETRTVYCRTLEQHFASLLFGKAERTDLLDNSDFQAHATLLTDWTTVGTTATIETTIVNTGTRAARLDGAGHITQTVAGITHSYDPGLSPQLAFYVRIPAAVAAAEGDGFIIARLVADNGTKTYTETITIGDVDRFDVYERVTSYILLAADDTWDVEVRLEGSDSGFIYWDTGLFTFNDAVTVAYPGDDLQVLVENIVTHAQDTAMGKFDLLITVDATPTGLDVLKGYAYADHENIWDALREICKEYDCDIWIDLSRVVHVELKRGGAVGGLDRSLDVPDPANPHADVRALTQMGDVRIIADTTQQASALVVAAEGEGFAREEAGAAVASPFGGPVIERFEFAPPSTQVRDLQTYADNLLARESRVALLPSLIYPWADAGTAEPGDTGELFVNAGCVYFDAVARAETWAVNIVSDTVQVTFDEDL